MRHIRFDPPHQALSFDADEEQLWERLDEIADQLGGTVYYDAEAPIGRILVDGYRIVATFWIDE